MDKLQEKLIHSEINIWVQQNFNYDSLFKRSNEMKKANPASPSYLLKKSQIQGKKWRKTFLPTERLSLFILNWRNTKCSKKYGVCLY